MHTVNANPTRPILNRLCLFVAALSLLLSLGCDSSSKQSGIAGNNTPSLTHRVVTVSYPLQYLTQRIAGDALEVRLPVPEDADPRKWRPNRDTITSMQAADLIIANGTGADYANWLTTATLPESKMCYTAKRGLSLTDYIAVEDVTIVHSHGPEGEHSHATMVSRTWLDPEMAKQQSVYIAEQLAKTYPELADAFDTNLKSLSKDLDGLTQKAQSISPPEDTTVLTIDPELKFLTRAVGVEDIHLLWFERPQVEQAKTDLDSKLKSAQHKPGVILFHGTPPDDGLAAELSASGLKPVMVNLIDHAPATGDYLSELKNNIQQLESALKPE